MNNAEGFLTEPLGKASTKRQGRINPSVCIINVITRGWKGNCHFGEGLKDSPDAGADEKVSNDHVPGATTSQSSTGPDEQPRADIGTKRYDLRIPSSARG